MNNPFCDLTNAQLGAMYAAYEEWNNTGVIPDDSVFAELRELYKTNFGASCALVLMERDYLKECAKRFADLRGSER